MPDSDTLRDFEEMRRILSVPGYAPPLIMLGKGAAEAVGVEPGVYRREGDKYMHYTFEEWDGRGGWK